MADAFMGIDQSFSGFGIAVWIPEWGQARFDLKAYPANKYGSGVDRLKAVTERIVDVSRGFYEQNIDIQHICMEGYARNAQYRREEAGELAATVKLTLSAVFSKPISYPTIVAPKKLKAYVTGNGNSNKADMRAGVLAKWGELCWDHNLADAYGLARMAETVYAGTTDPQYPYEADVLAEVVPHSEAFGRAA